MPLCQVYLPRLERREKLDFAGSQRNNVDRGYIPFERAAPKPRKPTMQPPTPRIRAAIPPSCRRDSASSPSRYLRRIRRRGAVLKGTGESREAEEDS